MRVLISLLIMWSLCNSVVTAGTNRPVGDWDTPQDDPVSHGGRLYDKWWAELNLVEPTTTHPAYPETGQYRGAATWRCKECHGWDYRGEGGAYGDGRHYTGTTGIRGLEGGDPYAVIEILKDKNHQYQQVLPPQALEFLAAFVVEGQVDMNKYIEPESGEVAGADLNQGKRLYNRYCARCHGEDGRFLNFSGDPSAPEYVGTVAKGNPWEAWHKIRNGQPGSYMPMGPGMMGRWRPNEKMPPFRSLSLDEQLAILSYLQRLPVE